MAAFLRKKNKEAAVVKPVPSAPIPLGTATQPPPLFARFATSTKISNAAAPRIVSSPMVLSSKKELVVNHDGAKRRTTQNQASNKSVQPIHVHLEQHPPAIVDKPLPPPFPPTSTPDPLGSTPTQSFRKQSRPPPSAFQNQGKQRTSLDNTGDGREPKRPPSSQSFYSAQSFSTDNGLISNSASQPSTANNNPLTSPPRRNSSLSNAFQDLPPIAKQMILGQQNTQPPASGRQILSTAAKNQTPLSSSVANQDLQPDNVNANISMIGASLTHQQNHTKAIPLLPDVDLPPEFALFREFHQFDLEDRNSASTINPYEHVPASNVPRSTTDSITHSRPLDHSLPPAMGVATSHPIGNDLLSSSLVKEFYPPRAVPSSNLVASSLYNTSPAALNQRHYPSLPPVTFNSVNFSSRSEVSSNRGQLRQDDLQHSSSGRSSSRKSSHSQVPPPVPMKNKPRIFAAMATQEGGSDRQRRSFSIAPAPHPPRKLSAPSTATTYVQRSQYQPSATEVKVYANGSTDPIKSDLKTFASSLHSQLPTTPSTPKISTNHIIDPLPPPSHTTTDVSSIRDSRPNGSSRSILKKKEERPQSDQIPCTPSRGRRLSKARTSPPDLGSSPTQPVPSKTIAALPTPPISHHRGTSVGGGSIRSLTKSSHPATPVEPVATQLDEDTASIIPLDDDPFARVEGVTLLKPQGSLLEGKENNGSADGDDGKKIPPSEGPSISSLSNLTEDDLKEAEKKSINGIELEKTDAAMVGVEAPPIPVSSEQHRKTKKKKKRHDDESQIEPTSASPPSLVGGEDATTTIITTTVEEGEEDEPEPEPYIPSVTIIHFLSDPQPLSSLLTFLSFYDWCVLSSLSNEIRTLLVETPALRETVLERFLKTVGYSRWNWDDPDPLSLSLQDLNDYMRGVSTPTHEYARVAGMYVHSLTVHPSHRDPALLDTVQILTASTRAYTRVVLRLRAQAEKEAILAQQSRGLLTTIKPSSFPSSPRGGAQSRVSSRAPSPTTSSHSHSHNGHVVAPTSTSSQTSQTFRSPLFRLRRAPLLRVFVPSPEGDWLSDKSVLACEAECKRAGVMHLMRLGDVVWDVAVGDEGNVGRLVWDGSYLIDLDYTYTSIGDLPKYMPALAFPPSYFHRVIRTGPIISNPIVHIDISPWGEEIAMNLQLLQDRVRTETPQGAYHNVVRWVQRSSFVIRAPRGIQSPGKYIQQGANNNNKTVQPFQVARLPIPDTDNLFVDPGWYGTVVVETEGTNEALADLQERCGPGAFPHRSRGVHHDHHPQINKIQVESKKVFRILREKSRPGEIWIKAVGIKERIM